MGSTRLRWAAVGAATAIALGVGITWVAQATTTGSGNTYSPVTPCRLVDTRPGSNQVGERAGALAAGESVVLSVRGSNGRCTIGTDATGIATNVTVLQGTQASFLTVHPAHVGRPLASNLNWVPASPPPLTR